MLLASLSPAAHPRRVDPEESRGLAAKMFRDKNYQFVLAFDDGRRRAVRLPFTPARLLFDRVLACGLRALRAEGKSSLAK